MVSKESEYLIHNAEKQLERLNKYLYFYQKNNEIESDILSSSISMNHSNNLKSGTSNVTNFYQNGFDWENELKPIYNIIQKQRNETTPGSTFSRKNKDSIKRKQLHNMSNCLLNNDNIRDWRSGVNLARKSFGPTNRVSHKSPLTTSHSLSPCGVKKKERVSTFWNDKRNKRNLKSPNKDVTTNFERPKDNCCSKRHSDGRGDIQKYIRNKQKIEKDKRNEANMTIKSRKENIKTSLTNLQHYQYDRFSQPKPSKPSNKNYQNDNYFTKSSSTTSLHKTRLPTPIYDELEKDGLLEYIDIGNYDHSFVTSLNAKYRNGLNSTVDSGIETGEWHQSLTPDKFRKSYDRINEHNWLLPPPLPTLSKSTSQIDVKTNKKYKDNKYKSEYHNKLKEIYQEQISAYDASSENEVARESDEGSFNKYSLSPASSTASGDVLMNNINRYLGRMKTGATPSPFPRSHSKNSEPESHKKMSSDHLVTEPEIVLKSSLESINQESSRICLIQDLKEALYNAQTQLNLDNKDSSENISEKISQAVQNFIKVLSNSKEPISGSTRAPSCISPQSQISTNRNPYYVRNNEPRSIIDSKSESKSVKKNSRKETSTELEATEMELETGKHTSKIDEKEPSENNREIIKIPEEKLGEIINDSANRLTIFDINEKLPSISAYKQNLQSRQERANEVIRLTKDLRKESNRVIRLEKKAFEVTKRFISNVKIDNTLQTTSKKESISGNRVKIEDPKAIKHPKHDNRENRKALVQSSVEHQQQQTAKMAAAELSLDNKINESPHLENCSLSRSSQSENDEITISMSDITTTLTDQSELEARLLALQSEMKKKKQLVSKLKKRQKDLKRDKIKQKECVLQKQIEMYDNYIEKLQVSIDDLNSKIDDNISDDSHTLNGSTSNLHDLEHNDDQLFQEHHHMPDNIGDHDQSKDKISFKNAIPPNLSVDIDVHSNRTTNLLSRGDSLESLIENNKHIETDDKDLDDLYMMHKHYTEDKEKEKEKISKSDITSITDYSPLKAQEKESGHDRVQSTMNDNSYDISINLDNEEIHNKDQRGETNLSFCNQKESNSLLDDMVQLNMLNGDCTTDNILQKLYMKEISCDDGNTNVVLDSLVLINTEPSPIIEFQQSIIYSLPVLEISESKSADSKDQSNEDRKSENVINHKELHLNEKEKNLLNDIFNRIDTVRQTQNDPQSQSESSSINSQKSLDLIPEDRSKESEKPHTNQLQYAETISTDGSSISDYNSFNDILEENVFEDLNILRLSPKPSEDDLQSNKHILDSMSTLEILKSESCKTAYCSIGKDNKNLCTNTCVDSFNVEELVDNLLNAIILSEVKNFKPVIVEIKKEFPKVLTIVTASDYQSTPFVEENLGIISPVIEKSAYTFNVLPSEDLWELSDLTVEDPWKVESPISIENSINDKSIPIVPTITVLDKKLLGEKVSWLVPLKPEFIDPLIESAIKHLYESRKNRFGTTEDALLSAQDHLPYLFSNGDPVVTETEISTALFDSSVQQPYVDKRIISQIILEVFLEIYSFEKHLPQLSWNHSSFMVKNNVYSLWKGDTPPESFDLVRKIVRDHIDVLISQKSWFLSDDGFAPKDDSQSKIIKWCIRQQKDDVDKLLITDMRKEENEWIYYDEAEEEVKFQIADEIFNILIVDTVLWAQSISTTNLNC